MFHIIFRDEAEGRQRIIPGKVCQFPWIYLPVGTERQQQAAVSRIFRRCSRDHKQEQIVFNGEKGRIGITVPGNQRGEGIDSQGVFQGIKERFQQRVI